MEAVLLVLGVYYLWGADGFTPSTEVACETARDALVTCLTEAEEDARRKTREEIEELLR